MMGDHVTDGQEDGRKSVMERHEPINSERISGN